MTANFLFDANCVLLKDFLLGWAGQTPGRSTGRDTSDGSPPKARLVYLLISLSVGLANERINRKAWSGFGRLGCLLGPLRTSWEALEALLGLSWGLLRGSWEHLGSLLGRSWGLLEGSGGRLGPLGGGWGALEALWGPLGAVLGPLGVVL